MEQAHNLKLFYRKPNNHFLDFPSIPTALLLFLRTAMQECNTNAQSRIVFALVADKADEEQQNPHIFAGCNYPIRVK